MRKILQNSGLKATNPRLNILKALESRHCPLSAEDIHRRCKSLKLDLATVYRNLRAFEERQLVRRSSLGDGVDRFELNLKSEHHHHLVCRQCHVIERLPDCDFKALERFAKSKGFSEISHHLEIFGRCTRCRA